MSGESDLAVMLQTLTVERRPERYTVCSVDAAVPLGDGVEAVISESEGISVVATVESAERHGWPVDFVAAWLTLGVHSSLEAIGLTAAFSKALGEAGIPCNVLAGYYHDHILVPHDRADEAESCLVELRETSRSNSPRTA
jgi:hypothetical protein